MCGVEGCGDVLNECAILCCVFGLYLLVWYIVVFLLDLRKF